MDFASLFGTSIESSSTSTSSTTTESHVQSQSQSTPVPVRVRVRQQRAGNSDGLIHKRQRQGHGQGQGQQEDVDVYAASHDATSDSRDDHVDASSPSKQHRVRDADRNSREAKRQKVHVHAHAGISGINSDPDDDNDDITRSKLKAKKSKQPLIDHSQDDRLPRTIFIGNIPLDTTVKSLKHFFQDTHKCGTIESIRFRSIPIGNPKMSKRAAAITKTFHPERDSMNAYVVFQDQASIDTAVRLNGVEYNKHHLRVDALHSGNDKSKYDVTRSIFIGNISASTNEEQLREHFSSCGRIENVRIVRDKQLNISKGIAFVLFDTSAAVKIALSMNGLKLNDRELRVSRALSERQLEMKKERENKMNNKHHSTSMSHRGRSVPSTHAELPPAVRRLARKGKIDADAVKFMGHVSSRKDVKRTAQENAVRTARRKKKKLMKKQLRAGRARKP